MSKFTSHHFDIWLVTYKYTQRSLAKKLAISAQTITTYKKNERFPKLFITALTGLESEFTAKIGNEMYKKSEFIRNIGQCRWNGIGADLYENQDGTATIRFDKNGSDLPRKTWQKFDSVDDAVIHIERHQGSNGLSTLINILNANDAIK